MFLFELFAVIGLCIYNFAILLTVGKYGNLKYKLGISMLIWGVIYIWLFVNSCSEQLLFSMFPGEYVLLSCNYIYIMLLFLFEILFPGQLKAKQVTIMLTLVFTFTTIYYIGLCFIGQSVEELMSFCELSESLGEFINSYRFVFFFLNIFMVSFWGYLLSQGVEKYSRRQEMLFLDLSRSEYSWAILCRKILFVFFIGYFFVTIWGNMFTIMNQIVLVTTGATILLYKGNFYHKISQYKITAYLKSRKKGYVDRSENMKKTKKNKERKGHSFEGELPSYILLFKKWMDEEKPYLKKDFKLLDVTNILPLNRTYLSRVFNDGFGLSFSEVVCEYRIGYAKEILRDRPNLPMYKVAELCGFSSDTTFFRAFHKVTGITPKQFCMGVEVKKRSSDNISLTD